MKVFKSSMDGNPFLCSNLFYGVSGISLKAPWGCKSSKRKETASSKTIKRT